LDEENRTYIRPGSAEEQKWFWLCTITHVASRGFAKKAQQQALCTSRKECNKYDLTVAQCF
jgi:hypothetical protein